MRSGRRSTTVSAVAKKQLGLFSRADTEPPARLAADRELAARVPARILLGPSTWTFPGWEGIVYPAPIDKDELVERGLEQASRHPLFRTVGIDRSYYAPLGETELAGYAAQLPDGYPCVMKVWSAVTTLVDAQTGADNPRFFDAELCERHVLLPIARSFFAHAGPLVFQLAPIPSRSLPHPGAFADALDRFLGSLPTAFRYAVELRNRELLTGDYLAVLARHGVAHVLNLWERMPAVGAQLAIPGVLTAPFVVARLSIGQGHRYEDRKAEFAPFNRIVAPDEAMRSDVTHLALACERLGRTLFIVVNNKVEGSSPLTIRALMERIVAAESGAAERR